MKLTLPDLRWNVALLNGLAALFTAALAGMFIFMLNRIDDRFDKSNERVERISDQVSDLRAAVAGQTADIRSILEKLDDQPQGSSGTGQNVAVPQGTPSGTGKP
ncbi:hypothetical protein FHS91_000975 [Sphingobium xanthum]|uniref:hypothetical protein n=1 Tax=Sphingobium xanthum TaxID=1387165 RepID=UPI001C8C9BFB|nr:hypothetical protein [Sphingobium xanthum]